MRAQCSSLCPNESGVWNNPCWPQFRYNADATIIVAAAIWSKHVVCHEMNDATSARSRRSKLLPAQWATLCFEWRIFDRLVRARALGIRTRKGMSSGGEPRTHPPSPNGPVEMVFDKPFSHHSQFALWLVAYRRSETASVRPKKMARLYDAPMIPSF